MRFIFLVAVVVGQGASALAEPAPPPGPPADRPCTVTIVAAPDRVRAEIEAWVAAERRCSRTLELRIVATAAGLRVVARDDRGHVRERVVPDDQSIGALVVSWIADDAPVDAASPPATDAASLPPADDDAPAKSASDAPAPAPPPAAPVPPPGPRVSPSPPGPRASLSPSTRASSPPAPAAPASPSPPAAPPAAPRPRLRELSGATAAGLAAARPIPDPRTEWLTLAGVLSMTEGRTYGIRGDLDLTGRRWWSVGLFAGQLENTRSLLGISMTSLGGHLAGEASRDGWQVRTQVGAGASLYWLRNYCTCEQMGVAARTHQVALRPVAEVSALVGRELGARWSLAVGALFTTPIVTVGIEDQPRMSVMLFAGVRNRL